MHSLADSVLLGSLLFFLIVGLALSAASTFAMLKAARRRQPGVSIWKLLDGRAFLFRSNNLFTPEGARWCRWHRYLLLAALACFISLPVNMAVILATRP